MDLVIANIVWVNMDVSAIALIAGVAIAALIAWVCVSFANP